MSSPISTSSRQVPPAPQRPAAQPKEAICRVKGDRMDLGRALPPSLIEADVRLSMTGGTQLAADGKVTIQKAFTERLLRHALSDSKEIKNAKVGFEPQSGTYSIQAKITVKGIQVPLSLKVAPMIDQNQIGFQLREVSIPTRFGAIEANLVTRKVTEAIAKELRYNGFHNSTDPQRGVVRVDANNLLNYLGVLPAYMGVDFEKTRLSLTTAADGNVVVGLQSDKPAPEIPNTPASDIAVFADEQALQKALRHALGPDYEVQKVTLRDGGLKMDGQAEFKEGSDYLTAGKALLLLLAVAARDPVANEIGTDRARMMVSLALDVKLEGHELVVTPSLSKALGSLSESLQKAGFKPVPDGKGLRIDLDEVWKNSCATFDQLSVNPKGAGARMRMDIDSFIDAPWAKRDSDA